MFVCCFRSSKGDDADVLRTVQQSPANQVRSRVVPTPSKKATTEPVPKGQRGPGDSPPALQQPTSQGSGNGWTPGAAGAGGGGAQSGGGSASRASGVLSWATGNGKTPFAEYRDSEPAMRSVGGKGLLASLLSRTQSGTKGSSSRLNPPASTTRGSSRNKLVATSSGSGSDGSDYNGGEEVEAYGDTAVAKRPSYGRLGAAAAPKRGILKKADTQLDAAASGDEEALLRLAAALATAAPTTASIASPFFSSAKAVAAAGGSGAAANGMGPDASAATAAAAAAGGGVLTSPLSTGDVNLDMFGSGRLASVNAWLESNSPATAAAAMCGGGAVSGIVCIGSGNGTAMGMGAIPSCVSRLANSSTSAWLHPSGPASTGPTAASADPVVPARILSVRIAAAVHAGAAGGGEAQSARVVPLAQSGLPGASASLLRREASSGPVEFGRSRRESSPRVSTPIQQQPLQRRRQSGRPQTPPSYIQPVVRDAFVSDAGAGAPGGGSPRLASARSLHSASIQPRPQSPLLRDSRSLPQQPSVSINERGGGRRVPIPDAMREEILRSLPAGKSPMWYAHKLREILGTTEEAEEGPKGGSGATGSAPAAERDPVEDLEYPGPENGTRAAPAADTVISRRISVRSLAAASGAPGGAFGSGRFYGDPAAGLQRSTSRLQRSNMQQQQQQQQTLQTQIQAQQQQEALARCISGKGATTVAAAGGPAAPAPVRQEDPAPADLLPGFVQRWSKPGSSALPGAVMDSGGDGGTVRGNASSGRNPGGGNGGHASEPLMKLLTAGRTYDGSSAVPRDPGPAWQEPRAASLEAASARRNGGLGRVEPDPDLLALRRGDERPEAPEPGGADFAGVDPAELPTSWVLQEASRRLVGLLAVIGDDEEEEDGDQV